MADSDPLKAKPAKGRTTRSRGRAPAQEREFITLGAVVIRLAISEKQVQREMAEGMPHEREESGKLKFPWPDVRVWRDEQIRERAKTEAAGGEPGDKGPSLVQARARRELAEAELAELELAEKRGELVPAAEFDRALEEAFGRARARLLALPPKLGAHGVGHRTPREAQAALEPLIREVMEELHRAGDVPIESDDELAAA